MSDEPNDASTTAQKIMDDIMTRKGLGDIWRDYWYGVTADTQKAVIDAWDLIIEKSRNDG
jgi:hypothetical protein